MKLDLKSVLAAGTLLCAGTLSAAGTPVAQATCDGVVLNLRFEASAGHAIVNARGADDQIAWNNTEEWSCGGSDEASAVTVTAQGLRVVWNGGFAYEPVGDPVTLVDAQKGEGFVAFPEGECLKLVRSVDGVAVDTIYADRTGGTCGPRAALAVDGLERPQAGKPLSISANAFEDAFVDEATLDAIWYRAAHDQVPEAGAVVATGLERRFTSSDYEHWFVAVVTDRVGVVAVSDPVWFASSTGGGRRRSFGTATVTSLATSALETVRFCRRSWRRRSRFASFTTIFWTRPESRNSSWRTFRALCARGGA